MNSHVDYQSYIRPPAWKRKRDAKILLDGNTGRLAVVAYFHLGRFANTTYATCERCKERFMAKEIEVHHKTYERLGHERREDLAVLCSKCHAETHGKQDSIWYEWMDRIVFVD